VTSASEAKLGDVAEFIRGINFKPDDVVPLGTEGSVGCMRTKNVQDELDCEDVWGVPKEFVRRSDQMLSEGDILVSSANSWNLVGKCSWMPNLDWPASFGGFVSVLRANPNKVVPRFLYRWFASNRTQALLRSFGQKTTNISNLNIERCLNMKLPLPPLPEQRRIATILDQADTLRAKRREALVQLDSLTQSIFIEMFGDPVTNPKGWPLVKLGDVGTLDRGVSKHRPRNDPKLLGGAYPLIQTGDVANCDSYIHTHSSTYSELGLKQSKLWPAGTLCITIAANIAKTGILKIDACFPDSVVGFRTNPEATVEYVRVWLSFLQKMLEESAPESAQKNINLAILRDLDVPLPPIAEQESFHKALLKQNAVHASLVASQANLEALFASLQHRAFRGEL